MASPKSKVSQELKDTVLSHENIKEVHFDKDGNHYLNVYDHAGKKYGRVITTTIKDKDGKQVPHSAPDLSRLIVETCKREDIIGTSDK